MARRKKAVEINRKEYDRIRKMDHNSMQEHIAGYYDRGYAAGIEAGRQQAAASFNLSIALEEIRKIKGIGEAKLIAHRCNQFSCEAPAPLLSNIHSLLLPTFEP